MLPRALILGTLLALAIAACSGDSVTTAVFDNCTPGTVRSCVGPDGCSGDQVCEPDGAGYRLCDCRSSTAAGTGGGASASSSAGQGAGTTNGSGGEGGAGGMGGASTTTTGNGGSGGTPVGCDAEASCVDCATCTQTADCMAAWAACDQACLDATACLSACEGFCGSDQSCYDDCAVNDNDSCANQFPAGEPLAQALQTCTCGACPNACAGVTTCGALNPTQCDEAGYTAGNNPLAQHYGTMLEVQIPQLGQNGIDLMLIELHYADGATDNPRTVQLSGENFSTCVDCLRIRSHVGGTYFLAQSGTMEIVANGDVGDTFTVTLTDVTLAEVMIDPNTRQSTLVPNGKRWCIASFTTSVSINAGTGQCTTPPNDPLFDCNSASNGCSNPCELVSQCGCAPGASCVLDLNNNNNVCISAGNAGTGDACMTTTDCVAGSECLTSNMVESCYQYCDSNADCSGTGACEITVMGTTQQWCTLSCNPLNGTGCPTSLACEIDNGPPAFTFCRPEGGGTQGAVCTNGNSCDDGYTCVTVNSAPNPTCQRWCRVSNPACPGGSSCVGFGTPLIVGGNEYGACI